MLKATLTKWSIGLAVMVGAIGWNANQASAHLFHHGGGGDSCGSSGGSWGSSGGSSGGWGSSGGSSGGWGSSGGSSGGGWRHHRHWDSCCGSCGYEMSYGSSGGSWGGSSGGSWGGVEYSTPSMPMSPAMPGSSSPTMAPRSAPPTPPTPAGPGAFYRPVDSDSGMLLVSVPADARVFVNGKQTTSTGVDRQYISRGLQLGQQYAYEVRAEFVRDGKPVTETRNVQLTGGAMSSLSFIDATASAPVSKKTVLKLNVPTDAKVTLAGRETTSTGAVREFTTTNLPAGGHWNNYTIVVKSRGETKQQTISLEAGDSRELTFDFASNEVASSR